MAKMGFREGQGLGKEGQGRTSVIETTEKMGRAGLGREDESGLVRKAGMHVETAAPVVLPDDSDLDVRVEWVEVGGAVAGPGEEEVRGWVALREVEACDCLGDKDASPTADYDAFASRELAVALKARREGERESEREKGQRQRQRKRKREKVTGKD